MNVSSVSRPVLLVGGSGVVGAEAARALRRGHPDLPLLIGGRERRRAASVADAVGNAEGLPIDLTRQDLGLGNRPAPAAVITFLKDDQLATIRYAQDHAAAHVSISSAAFEIGPEVAAFVRRPEAAPVVLASNWLAGAATFLALDVATTFSQVTSVLVSALLDEEDIGGPAAHEDYVRQTSVTTANLAVEAGRWRWISADDGSREFHSVDGAPIESQLLGNLDVLSLTSALGAQRVEFAYAVGETASRRRGEPFSAEIVVEVSGTSTGGREQTVRAELVHPRGQAPVTAAALALLVERLLGLDGRAPVPPGLYLPDSLLAPADALRGLEAAGAILRRSELAPSR